MSDDENEEIVFKMGSTVPCGHVLDHSDPMNPRLVSRAMMNGKVWCPQCNTARWLPVSHQVDIYPEDKAEEDIARKRCEPSVEPFLREPPTEEELEEHKKQQKQLNRNQQITVEVLTHVFSERNAAFILCTEEFSPNETKDILNFMLSDYAQKGSEEFRQRKSQAIPVLKLCKGDFDSSTDEEYKGKGGKAVKRGGLDYYEPSSEWFKVGLNVSDRYENDDWLGKADQSEEWAFGYHGSTFAGNPEISSKRKFKTFGERQHHRHDRDINRLSSQFGQTCGVGAYFSSQIEIAHGFAEKKPNEETCVFEVRLKPDQVRIPDGEKRYLIVNDYNYARPTGICIRRSVASRCIFL